LVVQISKKRYEKHLKVGVRFDGEKFVLLDGSPLPKLKNDTHAELLLAPDSILDAKARAYLSGEKKIVILKKGSRVLFGVSRSMIEDIFAEGVDPHGPIPDRSGYQFVEARLNSDQSLQIRGDQEARLIPSPCHIPALATDAASLNHAFTLISEAFETKRLSHSGDVFERAFVQVDSENWKSLDELRLRAIQSLLAETKA